jgi:hypothetical protein
VNLCDGHKQRIGIYPATGSRWLDFALNLPLVAVCGMQLLRAAKLCFSLADRPEHVELCGVVRWPRVGAEVSFAAFE